MKDKSYFIIILAYTYNKYSQLRKMMIKNITGVLVICLTAAVIGSSASELPPECNDYLILDDSTRNVNHGQEKFYCDNDGGSFPSPDWHGRNWYRMKSPAGVVMTETSLEMDYCGTDHPGWIHGTHPTDEGETVTVEVCFSFYNGFGDDCYWSQNIQITNCGEYYVYFLPEAPQCGCRYCAASTF